MRLLALGLPLLVSFAAPALAQRASPKDPYNRHYLQGYALYMDGRYEEALRELEAAYGTLPYPRLLYNIAQTQWKLKRYDDARRSFRSYLDSTDRALTPALRAKVAGHIAAIGKEEAAARQAQAVAVRPSDVKLSAGAAGTPAPAVGASAAPLPSPTTVAMVRPAPADRRPSAQEAPPTAKLPPPSSSPAPRPAVAAPTPAGMAQRESPPPGPAPRRAWLGPLGWSLLAAGAAGVVIGGALVGVDGQPSCSEPDPRKSCEFVLNTTPGGAAFLVLGGLSLASSAVLLGLHARARKEPGLRSAFVAPVPGGAVFAVGGRY